MAERHVALALLVLLGGGCSTTVDYAATQITIPPGEGPVAIAVIDSRTRAGAPSWVGTVRSSGALPFAVTTANGEPLADAMREALVHAFAKAGHEPQASGQALPQFTLTIHEWASDGYFGSLKLRFAASLQLASGQRVGEAQRYGTLQSSYERRDVYGKACEALFAEIVEDLLAEVGRGGVRSEGAAPPPPGAGPETGNDCASCGTALKPNWKVCPVCAAPR